MRPLPDARCPDAVVVTGDVADDGSHEAYTRARELLSGVLNNCPSPSKGAVRSGAARARGPLPHTSPLQP
ncbi:hypothetical protein [Streptomyces sp. TRM68367]|uniref:hypothetical protein n=1 Tax=Streptomyces sp. TRM68367 TaxID=2758415 RepID=UPI00165A76CD|nr:hypothetical protein [Streptomyces sp. TRM68367]MBC9728262.1 hypothetical protein [Streptomyces sp. TRM68367]